MIPAQVAARAALNVVAGAGGCHVSTYSFNALHPYPTIEWRVPGVRNRVRVHRAAWQHWYGAIPDGMTVDHICRNKRCVRPDHLRLISNEENASRGDTDTPLGMCRRGHVRELRRQANGRMGCDECYRGRTRVRN